MGHSRAILVGIVMSVACGQKSSEPPPPTGSASPSPSAAAGTAAISAPERPALGGSAEPTVEDSPEPAPASPLPPPADPARATTDRAANPGTEFERQTRDPAWAGPTESEIRKRITKLGARVDTTECRHDRCLIALRGSEDQMSELIAKLESQRGLQGFAQSIYLTAPVEQGGQLVVRAYATFER